MCTAVTYENRYFGRNLDYGRSYGESVVLTPRAFPLPEGHRSAFGLLGIAHVAEGYPLYYDAMNEKGLAMAGLLFAGNACYTTPVYGRDNIPTWAFLPWILGQCEGVEEAERLLQNIRLTEEPFRADLPPAPLHWMIADRNRSIVVEATEAGMQIYENPVGVLTNNPPFPFQLQHLQQYLHLTAAEPQNHFSPALDWKPFSHGMGAIGLPGDLSSPSRFVRAAFVRSNSLSAEGESLSQFFHILGAVEQQRGCVRMEDGSLEWTLYTSCCDLAEGRYYYKTYGGEGIHGFSFSEGDVNGRELQIFPVI